MIRAATPIIGVSCCVRYVYTIMLGSPDRGYHECHKGAGHDGKHRDFLSRWEWD